MIEFDLIYFYLRFFSVLLVPKRQTLGSHRAPGGAIPTLKNDCEAHRDHRVKRYGPY